MNPDEIRESRRSQGISQLQLASMVGCSQPTISLIERQRIAADLFLMRKITDVLSPEEGGARNRHLAAQSLDTAVAFANSSRLTAPDRDLPKFLTIEQWKRPDFGGDLAVSHVHRKSGNWVVTVVAVDLAGSGPRLMQSSAYLSGWIRGILDSQRQPIISVMERLSDECRRIDLDASATGLEITGYDHRVGVDVDVVNAAFPPVLLVSDPPFKTAPLGEIGVALPLRDSEYLSATRLRVESGTLVTTTDGLLERLGGGDHSIGRRSLVKHMTSPKRHMKLSDWLNTQLPPRDDELAMVIQYRPWEIEVTFSVTDDAERHRAISLTKQFLENELPSSSGDPRRQSQRAKQTVVEAMNNSLLHARGTGTVVLRAVSTNKDVRVEVVDDGIGPPSQPTIRDSSQGFKIMTQYADHLYVESGDPKGCLIGMVFCKEDVA